VSWLWRAIRGAGFVVDVQFYPEAGTKYENKCHSVVKDSQIIGQTTIHISLTKNI